MNALGWLSVLMNVVSALIWCRQAWRARQSWLRMEEARKALSDASAEVSEALGVLRRAGYVRMPL